MAVACSDDGGTNDAPTPDTGADLGDSGTADVSDGGANGDAAGDAVSDTNPGPDGGDAGDATGGDGGADVPGEDAANPDATADVAEDAPPLGGEATLTAQVRLSSAHGAQIWDLYRANLTAGSGLARGDLYLNLCDDAACDEVLGTWLVEGDYLFSASFPRAETIENLPAGTFYARLVLDTQYSAELADSYADRNGFGPMDVYLTTDASPNPAAGYNPPRGTMQVQLADGQTADLGEVVLSSLDLGGVATTPANESGYLLTASSGEPEPGAENLRFRNHLKILDLADWTLDTPAVPMLDGEHFLGDLCGLIPAPGDLVMAVGVGVDGAYVFAFDTEAREFLDQEPVWIPHPDCTGETCPDEPQADAYPWLCRGTVVERGDSTLLVLIELKESGALSVTQAYPAAVVVITDVATGGAELLSVYEPGDDDFLTANRIFRGIAGDDDAIYLIEPSWSAALEADDVDVSRVYRVPLSEAGVLDWGGLTHFDAETANDQCGSSNNWIPGLALAEANGNARVFVGNDDSISVFTPTGTLVGEIDTRSYGVLTTSFALSPGADTLWALPNCKSETDKAHVEEWNTGERADLDRHAAIALDLTSSGALPALRFTAIDLDGDGTPDGGVDLEFLNVKADLLRWCEGCTGSVPPTSYTGPQLTVSDQSLFMRGTGIQSGAGISSSGLGQAADVASYDIASGYGHVFRGYNIYLHGPSSRWGYDLRPHNPILTYEDDVSTAAILFVP